MKTQNYSINLDMFDGEAFCRAACWYDLVNLSCDEVRKIFWLGKPLTLKPNQLATSVKLLADRWNMTAQTARTRLKEFVEAKIISMERIGTALIITLHNPADDAEPKAQEPKAEAVPKPKEPQEQKVEVELKVVPKVAPQSARNFVAPPQLCNPKSKACERAKMKLRQCRLSAHQKK
jgi:hypothetical protein